MISDVDKARIKLEFITNILSDYSALLCKGYFVTVDDVMDDLGTIEAELTAEVGE